MVESLSWLSAVALVWGGALLPAAVVFARLPSGGVAYAFPAGLATVGLATWLASSALVPYGTPVVVASLAALWAWSGAIAWRRPEAIRAPAVRWRGLAWATGGFVALFAVILFARSHAPDATATEKPMDLMVLTAVHRADRLPPPDPWLAGERLSYYHLGHTMMDGLGRLSGHPPSVTFNLSTATAGAAAGVVAAALALDLLGLAGVARRRARVVAAGVAVAGLLLVGPVVGLVDLLSANGVGGEATWGRLGVQGVPLPVGATHGVPDGFWWWWNTTRVLPGAITEYPAFTLILGDPHAHLFALPLALVTVALALVAFEGQPPTWRRWLRERHALALTAVLFAALAMTNLWDVVTFGAIWTLAGLAASLRAGDARRAALEAVRWAALPAGLGLALAASFLATIDPPPVGLAPVRGEHSDPARWLLVWLAPLVPLLLGALAVAGGGAGASFRRVLPIVVAPVASWLLALLLLGEASEVADRAAGWITIAGLAVLAAWLASAALASTDRGTSAALALGASGVAILLLTELVHIDDAFPGRMNTVFKFWFHAWALLAIAGGALAGLAAARPMQPVTRVLALGGATVLVLCSLATPAMAVSRAREGQARGIDAIAYLGSRDPALAAAGRWARDHLDPASTVLLQAVAESYTRGNMLSSLSGVPTVLAWPNHQRQWRGEIDEAARRADVDAVYTLGATPGGLEAARRWGATHVFIGPDEVAAYGAETLDRFAGWPVVFDEGAWIVAVPAEAAP